VVNQQHLDILGTDEWRQTLEERVFPFAFGPLGPSALGGDVLEVGPGPGMTTDLLRARLPRLTSIELDPDLATALRTRLAGSNVEVIEGDGTAMPFDDRHFSGVVMFTMLHHVPTVELQDAMFGEVARVLQPGGLFVASDGVARDELAALHEDDIYNPVDPASLDARLTTAGFREIEIDANSLAWACRART
jgi:SAM-dependent methyltransferase